MHAVHPVAGQLQLQPPETLEPTLNFCSRSASVCRSATRMANVPAPSLIPCGGLIGQDDYFQRQRCEDNPRSCPTAVRSTQGAPLLHSTALAGRVGPQTDSPSPVTDPFPPSPGAPAQAHLGVDVTPAQDLLVGVGDHVHLPVQDAIVHQPVQAWKARRHSPALDQGQAVGQRELVRQAGARQRVARSGERRQLCSRRAQGNAQRGQACL